MPCEDAASPANTDHGPRAHARRDVLAWLYWSASNLIYIGVVVERFAVGAAAPRLILHFHLSPESIGALSAAEFIMYTVMQIPSGRLADSFGPRRVLTVGSALAGLGSLLFAVAPTFWLTLFGRLLVGLGDSLIFVNMLRLQTAWFPPKTSGLMTGLTSVTSGIGTLLAAGPLSFWIAAAGLRAPFVWLGLSLAALAVVGGVLFRDHPSLLGLPSHPGAAHQPATESLWKALRGVMQQRASWAAIAVHAGTMGSFVVLTGLWGIPYLMAVYHMAQGTAGSFMMLAAVGMGLAGPVLGLISDRIGQRRLPIVALAALGLMVWLLFVGVWGAHPEVSMLVLFVFMSGAISAAGVLAFSVAREGNLPTRAGVATGFTNVGGFLAASLAEPLIGALLPSNGAGAADYQRALAPVVALVALGVVGGLLVPKARQATRQRA